MYFCLEGQPGGTIDNNTIFRTLLSQPTITSYNCIFSHEKPLFPVKLPKLSTEPCFPDGPSSQATAPRFDPCRPALPSTAPTDVVLIFPGYYLEKFTLLILPQLQDLLDSTNFPGPRDYLIRKLPITRVVRPGHRRPNPRVISPPCLVFNLVISRFSKV